MMRDAELHIKVSVIIPTFNNESTIEECINSIYSNNSDYIEVIVVDGRSTDTTIDIVKKYPVKILAGGKTPAEARNIGIKHANGGIIAFTDADCKVKENWIRTLSTHFNNGSIAGVGGPNITPKNDPFFAQCAGTLMESFLGSSGVRNTVIYNGVREVDHNPPVNSAVRKSVLEEVGGFNAEFPVSEDVEMDAKIKKKGYKLIYDPEMIVWHHRRNTLRGFIKQMIGYGRGRSSAFLKHPESLPYTYFCAMVFTVGTVYSIPIYLSIELLKSLIIYGWVTYFLFITLSSFYLGTKKRSMPTAIALPFLAFAEHFSLGLGFMIGLVKPYR